MNNYNNPKWQHKRAVILRRDEYKCQECKRYGKTTPAYLVHHIRPRDAYPELWLESTNLISLCHTCHNTMHDRVTDALTAKGLELVARIDRKYFSTPPPQGG